MEWIAEVERDSCIYFVRERWVIDTVLHLFNFALLLPRWDQSTPPQEFYMYREYLWFVMCV